MLFWTENGNLSAFYSAGSMPVALKRAIKIASAGYQQGEREWLDEQRKK